MMTDETATPPLNPVYAVVNRNAFIKDEEAPPPAYPAIPTSLIDSQSAAPLATSQSLPFQVTPVTQRAPPPLPVAQSRNPFTEDVRRTLPPSAVANQIPAEVASRMTNAPVQVIEQRPKPFWESGDSSFDQWQRSQSQEYYGEDEGEEGQGANEAAAYHEGEYYEYEQVQKKKGFFKKLLRSAQRFKVGFGSRTLGSAVAPSAETNSTSAGGESVSQPTKPRELTADELALNGRYSNPLHCRFISLEATDHTHPSDVRIQNAFNRIYLSDIGRSIVEIFDMNGQVLHSINDPAILKFQPNRFVVTVDGTLIISSAVLNCLYMYSPASPFSENFQYQQFKLGAEGKLIHQFSSPSDMVADPSNGYVYVCDVGNYRIKVLTPQGMCERVIQLAYLANGVKQYLYPTAITYQPTRGQLVCVVNNEDAICFFSKHANGRTYIEPLWISDENGLGLHGASSLAVDIHDRIFIADTLNHRIVICTPEGTYITSFGTHGTGLGQLDTPRGIDVAEDGSVIVAELGNKRLQILGSVRSQVAEASADLLSSNTNTNNLSVDPTNELTAIL